MSMGSAGLITRLGSILEYGRVDVSRKVTGWLCGRLTMGGEDLLESFHRVTGTDQAEKQQEKSNDDHKYLVSASFPAASTSVLRSFSSDQRTVPINQPNSILEPPTNSISIASVLVVCSASTTNEASRIATSSTRVPASKPQQALSPQCSPPCPTRPCCLSLLSPHTL
jgi:hypothetical protein